MEESTSFTALLICIFLSTAVYELRGQTTLDDFSPEETAVLYGLGDVVLSGPSTMMAGKDYQFTCQATCHPPCHFLWFLNGVYLGNGQKMHLRPANFSNSGVLACQAKNMLLLTQKAVYKEIRVTDPNNTLSLEPADYSPPMMDWDYGLRCQASKNTSAMLWAKNGHILEPDNRVLLLEGNSLLFFNPLLLSDNAVYQCGTVLGQWLLRSNRYTLRVNYGPQSQTILGHNLLLLEGKQAFRCVADCHPPCSFTWHLGQQVLGDGNRVTIGLSMLANSRNLTCEAKNPLTGKTAMVSEILKVTDKVSLVRPVSGDQPFADHSFSLACVVHANLAARLWFKNGLALLTDDRVTLSDNNSTLSFHSLRPSDTGFYQCSPVPQALGIIYQLRVNYGPAAAVISGPSGVNLRSDYAFKCSAQSYPPCNYTWYLNGKQVGQGNLYRLQPATAADNGTLECVAHNTVTGLSRSDYTKLTVLNRSSCLKPSGVIALTTLTLLLLSPLIH